MAKKPTILILLRYYLPGFQSGGPVRSVSNMVAELSEEFAFRIITSDRDYLSDEPYPDNQTGRRTHGQVNWHKVRAADVLYLPPADQNWRNMIRLIREIPADVIYLNSLFDPLFSLPVLWEKWRKGRDIPPLICAPRGETSSGALAHKPLRKSVFFCLLRMSKVPMQILFHATAETERMEIHASLGRTVDVHVAGNFTAKYVARPRPEKWAEEAANGPLKIAFLSRIHPKKNLDYLLTCLYQLQQPAELSIYGPIDDKAYWEYCQHSISKMPSHISTSYHGAIEHSEVMPELSLHNVFFFPTKGENFGHVIHEAIQAGCVLLISDKTPWQDLSKHRIGWALPLSNKQAFIDVLEELAGWRPHQWEAHNIAVHSYADRINITGQGKRNHLVMLRKVAENGS